MSEWSNLAKVVYKRTYARNDFGRLENWEDTVERVIGGNVRNHEVPEKEIERLRYFIFERKAMPAGRGLWFSGAPAHERLGGAALINCWFMTGDDWENLVLAQDLLMLGGGVGMSVEHKYVSQLPEVKRGVKIVHAETKDADFITPDSREGWCALTRKLLKSYFVSGKSFSYSTVCLRGKGQKIKGFGGKSSGPEPVWKCVKKMSEILDRRAGKKIRPIEMADLLCCIAEMVVAGNVRRSALMIIGDWHDKTFLRAKRWDLGPIPTQRSCANYSIIASESDELTNIFWKTYEIGEPFGIINRKNIKKFARMGELKVDHAIGVNPCSEATLTNGESCNLQDLFLPHLNEKELIESARLMHRYGKRVTLEHFHNEINRKAIEKYRRIGTGITGCLQSKLFAEKPLTLAYNAIQEENKSYSKALGIPESIRTTVVKPSGTLGKIGDVTEGISAPISRYYIQRIRFSADDKLIPLLRKAGHHIEPVINFDNTLDHNTLVVDFYVKAPDNSPVVDEGYGMMQQLETVKNAQKWWADQSVSVTVYYKKEEISVIKEWMDKNLSEIKTISFLPQSDHGFKQAPKEAINEEQWYKLNDHIEPIDIQMISEGELENMECEGGACPVK